MKENHFTIILPTRDREDTLQWSLKTCTMQDYDNLTIIVSDNMSIDNTEEIVKSFKDERIKYVKTPRRISLSHNWEYGLSFVKDGIVTFLGDDDGFLVDGISEANEYFNEYNLKALMQERDGYAWPNHIDDTQRNRLVITLEEKFEMINSREMLHRSLAKPVEYMKLPIIYKGFVEYDSFKKIMNLSKSRNFFRSMIPDVYSGVVFASLLESYGFSHKTFSLNGASGNSGGSAIFNPKGNTAPAKKLLSEENIPIHDKMVFAPSIPFILGECILQAQDIGLLNDLPLDFKSLLKTALLEADKAHPETSAKVKKAIEEVGIKNNLEDYVKDLLISSSKPLRPRLGYINGIDIVNKRLSLDASKYGVTNIYEAALLHHKIKNEKPRELFGPVNTGVSTLKLIANELRRRI